VNAQTTTWATKRREITRIQFPKVRRAVCRALQIESTPAAMDVRVFMEPNEETGGVWQKLFVHLPDGSTAEIRGSDFYFIDVRRADGSFIDYVSTEPPIPEPVA
jgi:hypothetical protein